MNPSRPGPLATTAFCFLLSCLVEPLCAQTPISGNQSGTLAAGVYHATGNLTVAVGQTWTLNPGVIIKFTAGYEVTVDGSLIANGTAANPVIFSDDADDTAGGNTNGGGVSTGVPTSWRGIVFNSTSSASVLNYVDARYGGASFISNFHLNAASPTFTNCISRDNYTDGMELNGNSFPTVTNCTFTNNGGYAIEGVSMAAVPGLTNNTATGNFGNFVHITVGTVAANVTLDQPSMMTGALGIGTNVVIVAGATLTLNPGVILKFINAQEVTVDGTLVTNGTAANPVIFTDDADDSAGGNTNGGAGVSVGVPTGWRGIVFNSTSGASMLHHADIRFGGASFISNVHLNSAGPTLTNCTIRDCYTDGMELNGNSFPTVSNCTFTGNGGRAVDNVDLAAVAGFTDNVASGNNGNYLRVTGGSVSAPVVIGPQSILQGALMIATNITVQPTGTLIVEQGVNFKFESAYEVIVNGAVNLKGTSYEPIVFTAAADDSVAGDTNNNGPSVGSPTAWRGFTINAGALASRLENVVIRYTGSSFIAALTSSSPNVMLRSCRVDGAYDRGFVLSALAANPVNLVAWSCGGHGIQVTNGSFDLVHATCAGNGTGIRRETAWAGRVVNSNIHGNSTNFANFVAAQVLTSNGGFPGVNGNLNANPLFVDINTGDLHLGNGSPCLGAAEFFAAVAVQKDHDENSRILDHTSSGFPLADMGAFELPTWGMTVTGAPRIGSLMHFTLTGPPGDSFIALGLLDGTVPVLPYGMLLAGSLPSGVALLFPLTIPVGIPIPLPLANDPYLIGIGAGIQTLTFPSGNLSVGNFTRLYRILIRS